MSRTLCLQVLAIVTARLSLPAQVQRCEGAEH